MLASTPVETAPWHAADAATNMNATILLQPEYAIAIIQKPWPTVAENF